MAKEMAALPVFQDKDGKNQLSVFLSKLFNGTLLAEHDENGKILKDTKLQMDLRGELGLLAELARQALPVAANECYGAGLLHDPEIVGNHSGTKG